MDFRKGTCNDCGTAFKVPASFTHSRAKCKSCGGVVEIGEVQSASAAPEAKPIPAKKIAPASEPQEIKPSGKKRSGPSMKEKLLAQREAGAAAPAAEAASTEKAAPARRAATARSSTRASASSSRSGASKARAGKRSDGKAGKGKASKHDVHRSAHVGGKGDKHQDKSPVPMIAGIVVALLVLVGGFLFKDTLFGSGDEANAGENTASNDGAASGNAADSEAGSDADASTDASTESAAGDSEETTDADDEQATDDEELAAEEDDGPPRGHPDSVDLSQLPDIEPFGDTTDEEWTQMNEWMTTFITDSSARGNRAGNSLKAMYRKALPVIMNQFKTLDFGEQDDVNTGDVIQRMLTEICGGKNYTWKYDTEDSSHFFNKRVVEMWQGLIVDQALASELAWAGILKVDISELPDPAGGAAAADSTPGFTPPDFGDLDDIDD